MDRIKLLLVALGLTSFAAGCADDISSEDIKTSGVRAEYTALESKAGEGTQVTAKLLVDSGDNSNTDLDFTGEDAVTVTAGDETITLKKHTAAGDGKYYDGTLSEEAEDAEFTFSFNRGPDDEDAPSSVVTLPPAFELSGLEEGAEVSRASDLTLTWEGSSSSDEVRYSVEGDCLYKTFPTSAGKNDGSVTIPSDDMKPTDETKKCGAKLYVELVRKGTVDPAFGGGTVEGIRRRWITFVSVP